MRRENGVVIGIEAYLAHFHLKSFAFRTTSSTPVSARILSFLHLPILLIPSIALSTALCAALSFCACRPVSDHVSEPYVIAGMMTLFIIFLLRQFCVFLPRRKSLHCPKRRHPSVILPSISLFLSLSDVNRFPK